MATDYMSNDVEAIFDAARKLSTPAARKAFLDAACAENPEWRRQIEELLEAQGSADQLFEPGAAAMRNVVPRELAGPEPESPPTPDVKPGERIGRYKLLEKIGEGGMGVVYMAEQREPVVRKVALKIIKAGMDTRQVVARFEAERQALALMDHPNIAKVWDGGANPQSRDRPYFVMELVQGVAITQFCDQNQLAIADRLALFIKVCQAVQHAHQKGIIHRDLKPSNVLVTMNDGVAHPMVIDFGVAKAIDQNLTEKTLFTNFGTLIGTPAYMSPEQAEMSKLDVDTRADIYSLGVLLYALLTGTTPFAEERLRSVAYREMQRIILEEEPEQPSTRLRKKAIAKCEIQNPKSKIDSDLDWIVMKCLEKDRARRYETANGLATDVRRHLDNEAVVARPPSTLYRLRKVASRNKVTFAAGVAVMGALLFGGGLSTLQAIRATRSEREQTRLRTVEAQLRGEAQIQAKAARRRAYASDINLAQQALALNKLGRARELLDGHIPEAGQQDLRGWEWRYLWSQCQSDALFQLCQKTNSIASLAVSYDGKWLAVGESQNGGLSIWDLRTRQEVMRMTAGDGEVRVAFSPRELLLAFTLEAGRSSNHQCVVRLWDHGTKRAIATMPLGNTGCGVSFSEDGRTLMVSTVDPDNRITLWNVPDGKNLASYPATQRDLAARSGTTFAVARDLSVAAHPDTGNKDARIHLIDLATGRERWSRTAAVEGITALAISPDGKYLASGAGWVESDIRLWNAADGKEMTRLVGHRSWISSIVFWPDGSAMASASGDQTIRLWDIASPKEPRLIKVLRGHKLEVWRLVLLPDATTVVSGSKDGSVCVWDTTTSPRDSAFMTLSSQLAAWRFAPDSQSIITVSQAGRVERWSGAGFQEHTTMMEIGIRPEPRFTHLSRDGKLLAVGATNGVVHAWNLLRQTLLWKLHASTGVVWPVAFTAGGKSLVIRHENDASLHEWNLTSGTKVQSWRGAFNERDLGFAFSPDESQCLTLGYYDGACLLRDMRTGRDMTLNLDFRQADGMEFSRDGKLLAAGSDLGIVKIWETATYRTVATFAGFMLAVNSAVFSPDGKRLAMASAGSEAIKLLDVEGHLELLTLEGRGSEFEPTAFSPDGNLLGTMSTSSGVLHLWRAPSWEEIAAAEKAGGNSPWPDLPSPH